MSFLTPPPSPPDLTPNEGERIKDGNVLKFKLYPIFGPKTKKESYIPPPPPEPLPSEGEWVKDGNILRFRKHSLGFKT